MGYYGNIFFTHLDIIKCWFFIHYLRPTSYLQNHKHFHVTEYASVGYMAKRIQMRKNRFLALQKMAEQKKNEAMQVIK